MTAWDERVELYNYLVQKAELERAEILILERLLSLATREGEMTQKIQEAGFSLDEAMKYMLAVSGVN